MELLPLVEAEGEADRLLQEAQERKERMIKEALEERRLLLASIIPPKVEDPILKPLRPDLAALRKQAAKNRSKAIAMIMEEL